MTVTPVAGLGTGAFDFQGPNAGPTPGLFQLHFGKGHRLVTLAVATGGRPDLQAAQALASIVYPRLP